MSLPGGTYSYGASTMLRWQHRWLSVVVGFLSASDIGGPLMSLERGRPDDSGRKPPPGAG
jgi:hypothetical protein